MFIAIYICLSAVIEAYGDILTDDKYKTVFGNAFSTIPLYTKQAKISNNNIFSGCHVNGVLAMIEYDKHIQIGSKAFWTRIREISRQSLHEIDNKFPMPINPKISTNEIYNHNLVTDEQSLTTPCVTNPGQMIFNNEKWKYKVTEFYGSSNPATALGAAFLLSSCTIKGIDEMNFCFGYGTQFITNNKAIEIVDNIKQKLAIIASLNMLVQTMKSNL